jgi:hypothetical protein
MNYALGSSTRAAEGNGITLNLDLPDMHDTKVLKFIFDREPATERMRTAVKGFGKL